MYHGEERGEIMDYINIERTALSPLRCYIRGDSCGESTNTLTQNNTIHTHTNINTNIINKSGKLKIEKKNTNHLSIHCLFSIKLKWFTELQPHQHR